jgi:hypothetical protein
MPLKIFMLLSVTPETKPASVFITGVIVCANDAIVINNEREKISDRFDIIFVELIFYDLIPNVFMASGFYFYKPPSHEVT